jgi:hypothetical protein
MMPSQLSVQNPSRANGRTRYWPYTIQLLQVRNKPPQKQPVFSYYNGGSMSFLKVAFLKGKSSLQDVSLGKKRQGTGTSRAILFSCGPGIENKCLAKIQAMY